MSIQSLDRIFQPKTVAVIGASEKSESIGHAVLRNLVEGGYEGEIFPVNPHYAKVMDRRAFPSILDVPQTVDLAVVSTPISNAVSVIEACVRAGVGGAVILSAGGKEIGAPGRVIEAQILERARLGGLRIIGPNCMGVISAPKRLNASFATQMGHFGSLALISQSGAICAAILDLSIREHIGFRYFVSIGSMLDVDFGDLVNYLGHDPSVSSIILYVEHLTSIRKFMSAARAVARSKPIVVLKSGKSLAGARAASSHTGAMAGEDACYDAAFKRAGIVRVSTIEELFDCAELMAKQPIPEGSGLAIMTNGGGPGVMAADTLATFGYEPASLLPKTVERLNEILPPFWSKGNPIDILGDAPPERWSKAIRACLEAHEINGLVIIFVPQALSDGLAVARVLADMVRGRQTPPLFAVWMGGENVEQARSLLNQANIPTFETPERAVTAFVHLYSYALNLDLSQEVPPRLPASLRFREAEARAILESSLKDGRALLTEVESKGLLDAYGIPVNETLMASSVDEALAAAERIGYPVVMKVSSRDIIHKSDAGGVRLDLKGMADVQRAFTDIMAGCRAYDPKARILGVSVQRMVNAFDCELILGSKRDPDFGPVILFGMGGVMTEVMGDRAIALPPLNRLLARRLMEETRVFRLLKGYRNRQPANLELLEEILIRLCELVKDFPEIVELDINPLVVCGDRALAVDARAVVAPSEKRGPEHLVISPYPNQYELRTVTKGGLEIFVRPIRPEDGPLLEELFAVLTPQTIYYRFLSPMKSIPRKMLALFTQIDYDLDMALVALQAGAGKERMLGVSRLIADPRGREAEFAVLVGDPWQGKGIGATLMEQLVQIAKQRDIDSLWGVVLATNSQMLALGMKLGFQATRIPDSGEYRLSIDLRSLQPARSNGR
jgi:acetyltransferase